MASASFDSKIPPARPAFRGRAGAALVVVLCLVLLLTALVVAFVTSVKSDLGATVEYSLGQEVSALSETAVNLVMGQIREATLSGIDAGTGEGKHAWASQPGALRVWDEKGDLVQLYKLYSAQKLKETDLTFLATEIPEDWRARPNEYVDLNQPVAKGVNTAGTTQWRYPILDPAAAGVVDGFSSDQSKTTPDIAWNTAASMPVRWVYINPKGELSDTLQSDSVGRIAWWTDDETCKVNINTASATAEMPSIIPIGQGITELSNSLGYSFWTTPHSRLMQDYNMGRSASRQDEFQRYTSHPASVNLLTVLKGPSFDALGEPEKLDTLRSLFSLFPRYRWGGSENARRLWQDSGATDIAGANQKHERLYASVDELKFSPDRDASTLPAPAPSPTPAPTDAERLSLYRFFLTASSRAPDTNLFGQPRVSLWPLSALDDSLHRTTQDRLIAFCSTVKGIPYYFVRRYPFSQTKDWDDFARNQAIFAYLRELTSREIPGFGGNYLRKYDQTAGGVAGERDQILTAMFDYIRVVNLNETFAGKPPGFESYTPDVPEIPPGGSLATYHTPLLDASPTGKAGAGMVLPILTPYGRGAGRIPVLSEVALFVTQPSPTKPGEPVLPSNTVLPGLLLETFSPMQGYMPWTPRNFQFHVQTAALLNGEELFLNASTGVASNLFNRMMNGAITSPFFPAGGTDGLMMAMAGTSPSHIGNYVFSRRAANPIPAPDPTLEFSGGSVKVELRMASTTCQTYNLELPPIEKLPRPLTAVKDWGARMSGGVQFTPLAEDVAQAIVPRDGDYRLIAYLQEVPHQFFRPHPLYGTGPHFAHTMRFSQSGGWAGANGTTRTLAGGSDNGTFVGLPYNKTFLGDGTTPSDRIYTHHPDLPPDITDLVLQRGWEGDWDQGVGPVPDGAYLNKPDEGDRRRDLNQNYFKIEDWSPANGLFSPTLAIPSAMMFGSIPTAVRRTYEAYMNDKFSDGRPWRTLLFCPNPDFEISGSGAAHFGATSPPDYLLADLFNLPVVEPYAISEPLSTAGRINLNYQILPFTSLHRTAALRAVLSGQKVGALPNSASAIYKTDKASNNSTRIYHEIDPVETLLQFQSRFAGGDLFRSAAEICSLFLIPKGQTFSGIRTWWKDHRLTGDNVREKVYATLYPLLTTRSNTYTVHVIAQSLAKGTHKVTAEYRGSTLIERYIDPSDARIGTGGATGKTDPDRQSLEPLYRFRIVENKRFAP